MNKFIHSNLTIPSHEMPCHVIPRDFLLCVCCILWKWLARMVYQTSHFTRFHPRQGVNNMTSPFNIGSHLSLFHLERYPDNVVGLETFFYLRINVEYSEIFLVSTPWDCKEFNRGRSVIESLYF